MDEKELFLELKESGYKLVWYFREPGISNPNGNSPDVQFIVDLNGKELARRLDFPDMAENGWRIDSWHARDFGDLPEGAEEMDLHLISTMYLLGVTRSMLPEPLLHMRRKN